MIVWQPSLLHLARLCFSLRADCHTDVLLCCVDLDVHRGHLGGDQPFQTAADLHPTGGSSTLPAPPPCIAHTLP